MPSTASPWPSDPLARETLLRAPIGVCRILPDLTIAFANPALALMLGFSSPATLRESLDGRAIFHEESTPDSIESLAAGRLSFESAEVLLRGAGGEPVLARVDGSIVSDGAESCWVLFVREAGRERERDMQLARTLSELENTMQTIPDILYTLDVEARLVRWNRKMETATGYTPEELRGKPAFELFPEKEKPTFARAIMDAFASGYAEFETRLLSRGGSTIPYQWTAVPLEDAHRNVVGLAGAGRDISEWKRNEDARARLEELIRNRAREWQLTFDAIDSPIVLSDPDGKIGRVNRAARDLLGDVSYQEIVGKNLAEFSDRQPWAAFHQLALGDAANGGTLSAYDAFSGTTWDVSRSYATLGEPVPGEPVHSILIARDVTRMLQLQETARKNEVMSAVGQLIVGVAHEVRNPIFGISATLDAFEASFPTNDESTQFMEVLRGEIGRLSRLMQELLDYGRPSRAEFARGSLSDVAASAARACERTAEGARVRLEITVPADLPPVSMDQLKLVQVFQNLLDNAIQFSPPDSEVVVAGEVLERGGRPHAAISVLDRGRGFHEPDLGRIFEPFFTRRRGGTGLGLSIVQRIVDEHGGSLEAANREGGGARMTVFLPFVPPR